MKQLCYRRRSEPGKIFYWCPVCEKHFDRANAMGVLVMVSNEAQAIVCVVDCAAKVRAWLATSFPNALPDLDSDGYLLE